MAGSSSLISAALGYAGRGWPVFPCDPGTREPKVGRDKDAAGLGIPNTGGIRKATTDPSIIRQWWTKWPDAMIATAAGDPIGAFVLDVDVKESDGRGTLADLEDRNGQLPDSWEAVTPSGGLHLYFEMPAELLRNRVGFAPGLDVRTTGGSITLPPSRRRHGIYRWDRGPDDGELAPAPRWLIDLIRPPRVPAPQRAPLRLTSTDRAARYVFAALSEECRELATASKGGRNARLFAAAARLGELVGARLLPEEMAIADLEDAAASCGLTAEDGVHAVRATVRSGLAHGAANPRQVSL